ncbi:MAG: indolepyruvate ferredoxin oxidoreductase subunit alpha [Proteobacteria bacterium]|nr:indolepyruvate ferredoxin oxidoreductase subunit alpha [Pseudomonadota bacterium]
MHRILNPKTGATVLLLGNEAIARGALEAGVSFATCYPGTPSSEIPLVFFQIKREIDDFYFEYSTNEKVALETAAGAAAAGVRTMCTLKHVGLNVAADPLMTLAYVGVKAGLVIVNADDPSLFSSQNEQDNRFYARLSGLPMLEPTSPADAKELVKDAYLISEQTELPVLFRTTTRINHAREGVKLGRLGKRSLKGKFTKNPMYWVQVPAVARERHKDLLRRGEMARKLSNESPHNQISGRGRLGIITSGVSVNYVRDAVNDLGLKNKVKILKLGFTWPLPDQKIVRFLKGVDKVLVVEELEPVLETDVRALAQAKGLMVPIDGKSVKPFSRLYEYDPGMVREAIARYFQIDYQPPKKLNLTKVPPLPARPPNLCPGCGHRSTYYAVKKVLGEGAVYPTDIGCYTLGLLPPFKIADYLICMGSSVSSSGGFSRALPDTPVVAFIGDSTFFHSGITGLVNAVHNNHNFTLIILDNGTTAMTGHQPHPGVNPEHFGDTTTHVDIEKLVRGLGIEQVYTVNPRNVNKVTQLVEQTTKEPGVSVIIAREMCALLAARLAPPKKKLVFEIDQSKCKQHRDCLRLFACPAFYLDGERVKINPNLCIGCTVCSQVCPERAIKPKAAA